MQKGRIITICKNENTLKSEIKINHNYRLNNNNAQLHESCRELARQDLDFQHNKQ